MFVLMCCMSGCDYAESVDGVGVKKAHALVGRYRDFDRVLRALRFEHTVPRDYAQKLERALPLQALLTCRDRRIAAYRVGLQPSLPHLAQKLERSLPL